MQSVHSKWLIYCIFVILWSGGAIFVELGLKFADPLPFLMLRFLIATVLMWTFCLFVKPSFPKQAFEWRMIILTAIFQQIGYQFFYFLALDNRISPGVLTIILGAQPILTAILMNEGTNRFQWIGLLFGMIGLTFVVWQQIFSGTLSTIGILYSLFSFLSITVGTILQKNVHTNLPINVSIQYTCSFIAFSTFSLFFHSLNVRWTGLFVLSLLFMALGVTVSATLLLYYMISKGKLTNTTSIFYCVPPFTAILDYITFGHKLNVPIVIGMVLIILGMVLINPQKVSKRTVNQSEIIKKHL
ncbi:DMT family transporter [Sporolactobacillus putidus]|uniref:EamA domain-containing protein n=1 Tax=Sporolactobacillus putidus TaxID=492735 RepID=A0A917VXV7_9BACL|nr:DMT family transporter [Sporolactobacillus putidus]GGL43015.1 hypothetical protein GCM10007968_03690 [Sporolactobacillus putidus]